MGDLIKVLDKIFHSVLGKNMRIQEQVDSSLLHEHSCVTSESEPAEGLQRLALTCNSGEDKMVAGHP